MGPKHKRRQWLQEVVKMLSMLKVRFHIMDQKLKRRHTMLHLPSNKAPTMVLWSPKLLRMHHTTPHLSKATAHLCTKELQLSLEIQSNKNNQMMILPKYSRSSSSRLMTSKVIWFNLHLASLNRKNNRKPIRSLLMIWYNFEWWMWWLGDSN